MTPKLRFPQYHQPLDRKSINEILTIGSGKDYKHLSHGDIPVYGTGGLMTYVDDYLYDGESVGIGRKGTIDKPIFLNGKFWTVDTLFYTHSFKGVDPYFVFTLFQQINWNKYNEASGVPSLSKSTVGSIHVFVPKEEEQLRIRSLFEALNTKINLLTKKKEALETYKKGLMQKIFSQEFRFKRKDGTDYPEWKKVKLSDEYEYLNAKAHEQLVVPDGRYKLINSKFVSTGGKVFKTVDQVLTEAKIGDVTMVLSDLPNGKALAKAFYIDRDDTYAINQRVCRLRALDSMENDSRFLYYLISRHRYFLKLDNGVGQTHISKSDVLDFQYFKPSLSEQVMISNTFNLVDDRIAMTIRKLNRIQQIKKGLLQQMFV